ncbi:MAG TPA: hypothetical protein VF140_08765, partial [Phycicoccus sp.]
MTVIDRLRSALPGADASPGDAGDASGGGPGWPRGAVVGVLTALVTVALVVVPAYLAWSSAEPVAGTAGDAVAVGAGLWLLTAGAHVTAGAGTAIALTPLLGLLVLVVLARLGA